jgi:flagellar hook protein FlgE
MNTAVSGLSGQASALSTIGDNVANSGTVGYKDAGAQFETLLGDSSPTNYSSGGISTSVRYNITGQGTLQGTTTTTDLAVQGTGFFIVKSAGGTVALTRAGAFVPDSSGNLVNTAGYFLQGYPISSGATSSSDSGLADLTNVNVQSSAQLLTPSTSGTFSANVPSTAAVVTTGNLPSTNTAPFTYTEKTTMTAYDSLGAPITYDVYLTKTGAATGSPPTGTDDWEVTVYNAADGNATSGYTGTTQTEPVVTATMNFNPTTGALASIGGSATTTSINLTTPFGTTIPLDLSGMTQDASAYTVNTATTNGSAPSNLKDVTISTSGVLSYVYDNGTSVPKYQIPLGTVESTSNLQSESGEAYLATEASGAIQTGTATQGALGSINSSSLEDSTVDLATELTNMIQAQQAYQANSKVLQTGSDLMTVINNLK